MRFLLVDGCRTEREIDPPAHAICVRSCFTSSPFLKNLTPSIQIVQVERTTPETSLRERKKQRTRELIAQTARRLFKERGFDAVTVEDVARAAEVSRKTVFNYFPTKEDLFFSGFEAFQQRLLAAVREREAGESMISAFSRFLTGSGGLLADPDPAAVERLYEINRLITDSPALLARERQICADSTDALAALISDEIGARPGNIGPRVAANAMIGLHQALVDHVRRELLAGERDTKRLHRHLRAEAKRAGALLENGLAQLDRRP
jgi:AcrR family transcriptional regulator